MQRNYVFLQKIFKDTLKIYKAAYTKWSMGTGGEDGSVEHYCEWDKRDADLFTNYASAGKGDYLAWIHIFDKKTDYAFNNANFSPPKGTVMEDSNRNCDNLKQLERKYSPEE